MAEGGRVGMKSRGRVGGGGVVIILSCIDVVRRIIGPRIHTMAGGGVGWGRDGGWGGGYSFVACLSFLSHLTIDHASKLSRQSTVPTTPSRDTSNNRALISVSSIYFTQKKTCHISLPPYLLPGWLSGGGG